MVYEEEKDNLSLIAHYLTQMEIPYEFKDIDDGEEGVFPAIFSTYTYKDLEFEVIVHNLEKWILIKCLVLDTENLSMPMIFKLYKKALELNYDLAEVTFSSYQGNIYIEMDALVGVDFDDFAGEFESIAEGIDHFVDFVQNQKDIVLSSTKGKAIIKSRRKGSNKE
jgi:hypothetical protein